MRRGIQLLLSSIYFMVNSTCHLVRTCEQLRERRKRSYDVQIPLQRIVIICLSILIQTVSVPKRYCSSCCHCPASTMTKTMSFANCMIMHVQGRSTNMDRRRQSWTANRTYIQIIIHRDRVATSQRRRRISGRSSQCQSAACD